MIGAIILGLLAGFIARGLMPGRTPKGLLTTLFLGLAGAVVGYLIFTGGPLLATAPARRPAASGGGPRERLPTGIAGSRATGPIRGKWLQAVLAQGGEVDRKVDRACKPLGEACASFGHRVRD